MSVIGLSDMVEVAQKQMMRQEARIMIGKYKGSFKGSGTRLKNSTINNNDDSMSGYVDINNMEKNNMADNSFDIFAVSNNQFLNDSCQSVRRSRGPSQKFWRNK
jgi:hypothetical protein